MKMDMIKKQRWGKYNSTVAYVTCAELGKSDVL